MATSPLFHDRWDAGKQLAQLVLAELEQQRAAGISVAPIVYALPRGGLPVAEPVAQLLKCPLSVVVAKKITQPDNPELAIGAVTAHGHVLWAQPRLLLKWQQKDWQKALEQAQAKAKLQSDQFLGHCPQVTPQGAIAILVDDGIATGMTIAVAAMSLREQQPAQIWICTPVVPPSLIPSLQEWGDRIIALATPDPFLSVSRFYHEFNQVETEEALTYLHPTEAQIIEPPSATGNGEI